MAKQKIGEGVCDRCAREVVFKQADGGALTYTCQHCDWRGYGPNGSEGARLALAEIGRDVAATEKPAAVAVREAVAEVVPVANPPRRKTLMEQLAGGRP